MVRPWGRVARALGAFLAALLAAGGARANEGPDARWELSATVPVAWIGGGTRYEISASDGVSSVRSRLEFPLQAVLAGLHARLAAPRGEDGGRWLLEASGLHSLGALAGTMEDSDWLDGPLETSEVGAAHPGLDVFSRSRASLTALVLDGRVSREHEVSPILRLAPLAGFLYQEFSYEVRDLEQVGFGPWATSATAAVRGRVLTYDVGYRALYVGGRAELAQGPLAVALDAWFSPFARAADEDDHVLRSKRSRTDAAGTAWQARAEGRLALGPLDALSVSGSLVGFSAAGTQLQTFYGGPNAGTVLEIDARLTSLRWAAGAAWTHRLP